MNIDIPSHKFNLALVHHLKQALNPFFSDEMLGSVMLIAFHTASQPSDLLIRTYPLGSESLTWGNIGGASNQRLWQLRSLRASPLLPLFETISKNGYPSHFRFSGIPLQGQEDMELGIDRWIMELNPDRFYLIPLVFLGIPVAFLLFNPPKSTSEWDQVPGFIFPLLSNLIIYHFFHRITSIVNNHLFDDGTIQDEEMLSDRFTRLLAKILLPIRFRTGNRGWETCCAFWSKPPFHFILNLGSGHNGEFHLPAFQSLHEAAAQQTNYERAACKAFLEELFSVSLMRLPNHRKPSIAPLMEEMKKYGQMLQETNQLHRKLDRYMQDLSRRMQTGSIDTEPAENEFFKGSYGWHIRYKGEVVKLKGNYHTGLSYIHKMLQYPGRRFYPNELEVVLQASAKQPTSIQLSESFQVEVAPMFASLNPENERELLSAFKKLSKEKPGRFDSFEQHIYYLSQMLYLAHNLKELVSKTSYIQFYKDIKEELDDKISEFEQLTTDKTYVDRVLRNSRIIRKPADFKRQVNRLRQRVTKSIHNAIKHMQSELLQAYFRETLTIGAKSFYQPKGDDPIDWKLKMD